MTPLRLFVALAALALCLIGGSSAAVPPPGPRVLILGFDGASAHLAERLLDEGRLPNLAALRDRGAYRSLATANPAQSPVSWAAMTTGVNPGTTGIYDFLRRRFGTPEKPVSIAIGVAKPVKRPVLTVAQRVSVVGVAGGIGVLLGLLAAVGLGFVDPRWRKGGRLQALLTLPAALTALAAMAVLGWVPDKVTFAENLRGGEPFWSTLDKAGLRCVALEAPMAFPADHMEHGACLSGLGVPDLQGTWGSWQVWSNDTDVPAKTETAGEGFFTPNSEFELLVFGPPDPFAEREALDEVRQRADEEKYRRELAFEWSTPRRRQSETEESLLRLQRRLRATLNVSVTDAGATVTLQDGSAVTLVAGEWSELLPVTFRLSRLADIHSRGRLNGRVRMLLRRSGEKNRRFRILVSPVGIDPGAELPPNFAISSPPSFAKDLFDVLGAFDTLGWPELTNPHKDRQLSDDDFLAHIRLLMAARERRLMQQSETNDWDCLFAMFGETDRVQHALWRHMDPKSPLYDPVESPRLAREVEGIYEEMDRIVGAAVAAAGPETHVLVVSDHGFAPFRRGVNLNNWLRAEGFQVAKTGAEAGHLSVGDLSGSSGRWFAGVDWSRTRAYAMGLGNIYLHREGREPGGIVTDAEETALLEDIRDRLRTLRDADGTPAVKDVYLGRDLYSGPRAGEAPDLVVGFAWGYRVSWQTCLGGLDADVITDNTQPWSGDHCSVDPSLVPGILFSSMPIDEGVAPGILDVVPSILELLGVEREGLEGASFVGSR